MATFTLLGGAVGIDLPDGRSIKADHRGRVQVDDRDAAAIRQSSAMQHYDAILTVAPGRFSSTPDEQACGCGYVPWPWITVCPRCGDPLGEDRA